MRLAAGLPNTAGGSLAGIVETAAAAEDLGWDSVWVSDHILVDNAAAAQYAHVIEALETLAFVAGRFRHIGIGTAVLVAPLRDPVVLARQLASLDLLSEGRLTVGVGVGWGAGEYANVGAADRFDHRGTHLDEAISLWRHLWSGSQAPFEGRFRRLVDFAFAPIPPREGGIPIWVGGASAAALRRAASADGYIASQVDPAQLAARVSVLDRLGAATGRARPTIAVRVGVTGADLAAPDVLRARLAAFGEAGADLLIVGLPGSTPDDRDRLQLIDALDDRAREQPHEGRTPALTKGEAGPMTKYKGAEILVEYLVKEQVPYAFGVCGHGIIGFLDALYDRRDSIRTITTHDEQAAGFMADAYYRVAHRPAITYTSCGPGSLNLAMAVANAFYDSSALMAITGNVPTTQFNRGPFQETGRHFQGDFNNVMRPYVKRTYQAFRPEMIPLTVRQAYALMVNGRPGPVHIDVPFDVFVEEADVEIPDPAAWRGGIASRGQGDPAAVARAADLLVAAERPVILAGNGVHLAGAGTLLQQLAEALGAPVITSPLGKGAIDESSPLSLGATGRNGPHAANEAARSADVLLALGTRFDDRPTSSWIPGMTYTIPPTKLIHVDLEVAELGRNYPVEVGIVGDVGLVLRQILDLVRDRADAAHHQHSPWLTRLAGLKAEWSRFLAGPGGSDATPIRPERLVHDLNATLPHNSIVLADIGVHHNWLVQQLEVREGMQFLQGWGYAAMGFGVAGSIGAQFAAPERPVVAVCGDGGFLMTANAVATAVEYGLPITWVIFNNSGYGSIAGQQAAFFGEGREIATRFRRNGDGELMSCDFAMMGRSMGAEGVTVERPGDLAGQLAAAIASRRPTVIDVRVDASINPPATGSWDLPPIKGSAPNYPPK